MTIFELIFVLAFLASVLALVLAAIAGIRGRRTHSLRILGAWGLGALIYCACALGVALLKSQHVIAIGDPWCFDDWCLTVESVKSAPAAGAVSFRADLRISSRARRVSQRALGAWIYLIDDAGQRFPPDADPSDIPLDVRLGPGESVPTSRTFTVPAGRSHLGLITGHGGPYCGAMDLLVIGSGGCLFHKPAMIRIQ